VFYTCDISNFDTIRKHKTIKYVFLASAKHTGHHIAGEYITYASNAFLRVGVVQNYHLITEGKFVWYGIDIQAKEQENQYQPGQVFLFHSMVLLQL